MLYYWTDFTCFDSESDDVITGLEQCTGNLKLSKNHMEKDLETVTELNTTQPHKESSVNSGPHFQPLYVSVIEVPDGRDSATELTKHEKKLLSEYQQREGVQVMDLMDPEGVKEWGGERYESAAVKHGDKAFHKFNKTLQVCPQQCLRYEATCMTSDQENKGMGEQWVKDNRGTGVCFLKVPITLRAREVFL